MKILVKETGFNFGGAVAGQQKLNIQFIWGNNPSIYQDSDQAEVDYSSVTTKVGLDLAIAAAIKAKIEASPKMGGQTAELIRL